MKLLVWPFLWLWQASGFLVRDTSHTAVVLGNASRSKAVTFQGWYDAYTTGRGIWKWTNGLEAYQTHFARFQSSAASFSLMEIGVQSGGSINMFKTVLGPNCHYYGVDINPKCQNFAEPLANPSPTTITIMDQGNANHWANFYATVVSTVDLIVDDGGHQPYQMLTTLQQSFAHTNPGGVHLIEDICGMNGDYLTGLFNPAAELLGSASGQVAAVHLYPFIFVVQKAGGTYVNPPPGPAAAVFNSVETLIASLPQYLGKIVHLKNAAWPSLLSTSGLKSLFSTFYDLHTGQVHTSPDNCFSDAIATPECTLWVENSALQKLVTHVSIFPAHAEVSIAAQPPLLHATRKGTEWIPYSG